MFKISPNIDIPKYSAILLSVAWNKNYSKIRSIVFEFSLKNNPRYSCIGTIEYDPPLVFPIYGDCRLRTQIIDNNIKNIVHESVSIRFYSNFAFKCKQYTCLNYWFDVVKEYFKDLEN